MCLGNKRKWKKSHAKLTDLAGDRLKGWADKFLIQAWNPRGHQGRRLHLQTTAHVNDLNAHKYSFFLKNGINGNLTVEIFISELYSHLTLTLTIKFDMIYIVYFFCLWNKPTSAQFVLESVTVQEEPSRGFWVEHRLSTPRFHQPHDQPEFKDQLQLPVSARLSVSTVCVNSCGWGVEYPLKSLTCLCQAGPPRLEALPGTLTPLTHQPARPPMISSPVEKQTSHSESNSLRSKWATIFTFTLTSWTLFVWTPWNNPRLLSSTATPSMIGQIKCRA